MKYRVIALDGFIAALLFILNDEWQEKKNKKLITYGIF